MDASLTPIVIGVISALVLALLALGIVLFVYMKSRRNLLESRRQRRARLAAIKKQRTTCPNAASVENVSNRPVQLQSLHPFRPTSFLTHQMYFPPAGSGQWMDSDDAAAAPRRQIIDVVHQAPAIAAPQQTGRDVISYAQLDRRAITQGLPNARRQPLAIRNSELNDNMLDQILSADDREQRKNKRRNGKKNKRTGQHSADNVIDAPNTAMTIPPRGVALAYSPQLIPFSATQNVVQVHAAPTPIVPSQSSSSASSAVNPPPPVAVSQEAVSASSVPTSTYVATNQPQSSTSQQTADGEVSWTRVSNTSSGVSGFRDGGFGGQSAVFSAFRPPAHQVNSSRRQYEDQEKSVNVTERSMNR